MRSTFILFPLLLVFALSIVAPTLVSAAPFRPRIESAGPELRINGRIAVIVPGESGASRARKAAAELLRSGAREVHSSKVSRRKWAVETVDGSVVLTATRSDAKLVGTKARALSLSWCSRINSLIRLPAIVIASVRQPLIVPTGDFRSFSVEGAALPDEITVSSDSSKIASSTFDRTASTVTVQGINPGPSSVVLSASDGFGGTAVKILTIFVENRAGTIDSDANATVTGCPAPRDVVLQAARTVLRRAVTLDPAGYLEVISQPVIANDLPAGADTTITATVRAVGSDLIPVEQTVAIHVRNDKNSLLDGAQSLFYSNNPETVRRPQTLFDAYIPASDHPVRLVYHHQNCTTAGLMMRVEIINVSPLKTSVHIVRGMSIPLPDPVAAGTRAGADFFRDWRTNGGQDVVIPARTRLELTVQRTQPNDVSSGIVDVEQTDGNAHSLLLRVAAEAIDNSSSDGFSALDDIADPETAALPELPLTDDFTSEIQSESRSDQIYVVPSVAASGTYTVGAAWLRINIGTKDAVSRIGGSGSALAGNYGVIYTINLALTNPTQVSRPVAITFESGAGPVSGIFTVGNDVLASVNNLYPPNEQLLTRTVLAPQSTQNIQIQTIPLSGSAYPATIVAHAL